jgi:ferredoxin
MGLLRSDEVDVAEPKGGEGLRGLLRREWDWWVQASRTRVQFNGPLCIGCLTCYEVCPVGCFIPLADGTGVRLAKPGRCVACGACALQCPSGAAFLARKGGSGVAGSGEQRT